MLNLVDSRKTIIYLFAGILLLVLVTENKIGFIIGYNLDLYFIIGQNNPK